MGLIPCTPPSPPRHLTVYICTAGARAQGHSPSLPISSQVPSTLHSRPLSSYVFASPGNRFCTAEILTIQLQHSGYSSSIYKTDSEKHQAIYDHLVQFTGCSSAPDTLDCLRAAPYATLSDAINTTPAVFSPNGLDLTWFISIDGELFKESVRESIEEGCYARIPILGGETDDEGT